MTSEKVRNIAISSHGPRNFIRAVGILVCVLLLGTIGYMVIEKWNFLDSLYMTAISITTVGYGEISPLSAAGRIFTLVIIFTGIGILAYILGLAAQAMVEFRIKSILGRRKLGMKIKLIKNHYIICGYGRIGRVISQELMSKKVPLVIVDHNPESKEAFEQQQVPYIIDDATNEDILIEAGVERAKGLIAVVSSDADNLFITMTARGLSPDLFILARADEEHSHKKLLRAGANRVVLPYLIGGQKMANTIMKPAVTEFLEFMVHDKDVELEIEELLVHEKSRLKGVTLVDSRIRQEMNVMILAIRKKTGEMAFNPSSESSIETGDTLIALGYSTELKRLASVLAGN